MVLLKRSVLQADGISYPVNIHVEQRDNAVVSIGKKTISIRLPRALTREQLSREILRMELWAKRKIAESPERFRPKAPRTYADGDELKVGKETFVLRIELRNRASSSARLSGHSIRLVISSRLPLEIRQKHIASLLSRCVARTRLPSLRRRILEMNRKHFRRKIGRISFRHSKSAWGSCSEAGNITISTRLMFAPDGVLDYVCLHELAHLVEHNHSDRFWALVEEAMPDYREKKGWLRTEGKACSF